MKTISRGRMPLFFVMIGGWALVLSGCASIGKALGVSKRPPDELQVVAKSPLSVPPDFNLRPPADEELALKERNPREMAFNALFPAAPERGTSTAPRDDDVSIDDILSVDDLDLPGGGSYSDDVTSGESEN